MKVVPRDSGWNCRGARTRPRLARRKRSPSSKCGSQQTAVSRQCDWPSLRWRRSRSPWSHRWSITPWSPWSPWSIASVWTSEGISYPRTLQRITIGIRDIFCIVKLNMALRHRQDAAVIDVLLPLSTFPGKGTNNDKNRTHVQRLTKSVKCFHYHFSNDRFW